MGACDDSLRGLVAAGVRLLIIGTYALKRHFPEQLVAYVPPDCDLVLSPEPDNVRRFAATLQADGWDVRLWDLPVQPDKLSAELLQGKYYLRATRDGQTIDGTYECPWIPWENMAAASRVYGGLPFAGPEHCLRLKEIKGRSTDLKMVRMLRKFL